MNDINVALDGLQFQPESGYKGFANLTITTDDLGGTGSGGALNAIDVVAISVVESASAPDLAVILPALDDIFDDFNDPQILTPTLVEPVEPMPESSLIDSEVEDDLGLGLEDSGIAESTVGLRNGSGVDIPDQIEVSGFEPYDRFDPSGRQGESERRLSPSGFIQHAVREAVLNPMLATSTLIPLEAGAPIWSVIDVMMGQMSSDDGSSTDQEQVIVKTTKGLTFTLTAGYVSWLLRAGYLSASLMSIAPLWRQFDPLPVLAQPKDSKKKHHKGAKDASESDEIRVERVFSTS
jgi:hypothetical protein